MTVSLKYIPWDPIVGKSALAQAIAWHQTWDKPLPEPMLTQFNDTYAHYQSSVG